MYLLTALVSEGTCGKLYIGQVSVNKDARLKSDPLQKVYVNTTDNPFLRCLVD